VAIQKRYGNDTPTTTTKKKHEQQAPFAEKPKSLPEGPVFYWFREGALCLVFFRRFFVSRTRGMDERVPQI